MQLPFTLTPAKSCGIYSINALHAQHILENYNSDNRKLSKSHVNKIKQNVAEIGWVFDGQPITFNNELNLTEGQHRLTVISQCPDPERNFKLVVTTGVDPNTFSMTHGAKPRRPADEIQRKDKSATGSSIAVLTFITACKTGPKLNINTAVNEWNEWRPFIAEGMVIADTLIKRSKKFKAQQRTVRAFAAFASRHGLAVEATDLLKMLVHEIVESNSHKLTADMLELWAKNTDLDNEGRQRFLFKILCVGLDRFCERNDGRIELQANLLTISDVKSESYSKFTNNNY